MDPRLLQVVVVIVLWAKKMKQRIRNFIMMYTFVFMCNESKQATSFFFKDCDSDRLNWSLFQRPGYSSRGQSGSEGDRTVS